MRVLRFHFVVINVIALLIVGAALAAEILGPGSSGRLGTIALGAVWVQLHFDRYDAIQVGVERHLGFTWLWQRVLQPMLAWTPITVAAVFAAFGRALIGRGRLRPVRSAA